MVICGLGGGIVNFFMTVTDNEGRLMMFGRCIVVGIGASFLVPLFLQMISSDLVDDVNKGDIRSVFVFVGFCLVASIFSRRFISTIGEQVLKAAQNAEAKAEEAKEIATENKKEIEFVTSAISEGDAGNEISIDNAIADAPLMRGVKGMELKSLDKNNIALVLDAFKSKAYTFRSASGIAKEISLPLGEVKRLLDEMLVLGWVHKMKNNNEQDRYALTLEGKFIYTS